MLLTSWRLVKMQVQKDFLGCPAYAVPLHISVPVIDDYAPKWWYTVQLSQFYLRNLYNFRMPTVRYGERSAQRWWQEYFPQTCLKNTHSRRSWAEVSKSLKSGRTQKFSCMRKVTVAKHVLGKDGTRNFLKSPWNQLLLSWVWLWVTQLPCARTITSENQARESQKQCLRL